MKPCCSLPRLPLFVPHVSHPRTVYTGLACLVVASRTHPLTHAPTQSLAACSLVQSLRPRRVASRGSALPLSAPAEAGGARVWPGGGLLGGGGARSSVPVGEVAAAAAAVMDGRHTLVERPAPTAAPRCPRPAPPSLAPNLVRGTRAARPPPRLHLGAPAAPRPRGAPDTPDRRRGRSWTGLAGRRETVMCEAHAPGPARPLCAGA